MQLENFVFRCVSPATLNYTKPRSCLLAVHMLCIATSTYCSDKLYSGHNIIVVILIIKMYYF